MTRPLPTKNSKHYRKFAGKAAKLGIEFLKKYMPRSEKKIFKAYQEDEHLNNIPLDAWDRPHWNIRLRVFQQLPGVGWSPSDTVCVLKHVAIHYYMKNED